MKLFQFIILLVLSPSSLGRFIEPLIYGYIAAYPALNSSESDKTVDWLHSRFHVTHLQFYDWQWKHHWPIKGSVLQPADSWTDISGRTILLSTVKNLIASSHRRGIKAMNYNLLYGALQGYGEDNSGVNWKWSLLRSPNGQQWAISPFGVDIYMFDPSNFEWQQYIIKRELDVFTSLSFDGWHVDQLGDPGGLFYAQF